MRSTGITTSGLELARAKHALQAAGLDAGIHLTRASSVTNEVWLGEDVVIRVNRRPDTRLWREAKLGASLPFEVGYPEVLGYGEGIGFDWLVARRRAGNPLSRCWPTMSPAHRRLAVRTIAFMLRSLHATECPGGLPDLDEQGAPQLLRGGQGSSPVAPLLAGLERVRSLANVDPRLVDDLVRDVKDHAAEIEPFDSPTLIHGDLTFENVLWDGDGVTALIDFEWARAAPADLELDVVLRFCAYPGLHVADDYVQQARAEDYDDVPWWLREDYPALFASAHALDRLRLYATAFEVRQLLLMPPTAPARSLTKDHPLNRLIRLRDRTSHLDALSDGSRAPRG